jgi:hypothetical protein
MHYRTMPKRWRVHYSGSAHADFSSVDPDALRDAGDLRDSYADIVADTLEVSSGTLVFSKRGTIEYVFAADAYWVVVYEGETESP